MEYFAILRTRTDELLGLTACENKTPDSAVCKYKLTDNFGDVPYITTNEDALLDVVTKGMSDGSQDRPFNPFQSEELRVVPVSLIAQ